MATPVSDGHIRVPVVDPVRLHRENLVATLADEASIADVVGAADGEQALRTLEEQGFSVLLLSMSSPDSHRVCRELVAAAHPARVVAYGVTDDDGEVLACAEAGVGGCLLQDEPQ